MLAQLLNMLIVVPILAEMETTTSDFSTDTETETETENIFVKKSININDTVDITASATKASFLLYDYLIPTIGTVIILTNLVVVISSGLILKKGQQPRSTYLFLGNVAMTDLVTGFSVVFGQIFPKDKRNHYLCAVQLGMIVSSTLTSVYSVGLIAIDRFLYILHGMQYQRWVYPTRARLLICLSWAIGLVIGFLPLMGWYGDTDNGTICWFIVLAPKSLILLTVLVGVIPLLIVLLLYSTILYYAIRNIRLQRKNTNTNASIEENISTGSIRMFKGGGSISKIEAEPQPEPRGILRFFKKRPSSSLKSPNKWKAIKVVLFTSGSFVLTWCPYFITSFIYVFTCDIANTSKECKTMRTLIASPLAILGFMNSFLNPVIYAWWHKGFRTFFKKSVISLVMCSRRTDDVNNSLKSKSTSSINISIVSNIHKASGKKSSIDSINTVP